MLVELALLQIHPLFESVLVLFSGFVANGFDLLGVCALSFAVFALVGVFLLELFGEGVDGGADVVDEVFFVVDVVAVVACDFVEVGAGVDFAAVGAELGAVVDAADVLVLARLAGTAVAEVG
jgi:hypothetical protein